MIERLIQSLQALASPADVQLAHRPDFAAKAHELVADFEDALRLVSDCPQIRLEDHQREQLEQLSDYLEARGGTANRAFWSEASIRNSDEWATVRDLAGAALRGLGASPEPLPARSSAYPDNEP